MKNSRQLRSVIRKMLVENKQDAHEKKKAAANIAVKTVKKALDMHIDQEIFRIKRVTADNQDVDYNGVRLVMVLGHADLPVKEMQKRMAARGGKFAKIYGDAPTSKTQAVRQLTNHPKAKITPDLQASSLKMLQMIGYEALEAVCDEIEKNLDCEAIANLFEVKRKGKGESHWELFLHWPEGTAPSNIQWETESYIDSAFKEDSYYRILPTAKDQLSIKSLAEIKQKGMACSFSVGNLTINVDPRTFYFDPQGGRNHQFYFCGWVVAWNDRPPRGYATSDSRYYYVGPGGGSYVLNYHGKDRPRNHRLHYDFEDAKKSAEKFIVRWMKENNVKFGQGVSPQYQAQLDALYNHDWVSDGYR